MAVVGVSGFSVPGVDASGSAMTISKTNNPIQQNDDYIIVNHFCLFFSFRFQQFSLLFGNVHRLVLLFSLFRQSLLFLLQYWWC